MGCGAAYVGDKTSEEMGTAAQLREDEAGTWAKDMEWALDASRVGWTPG